MVLAADEGALNRYRQRVGALEGLSSEQEAELTRAWRAGDRRAGDRLIGSNLKHVLSIAKEYRRWGVPMDDLVQQGNIGLLKAAERFDPEQQTSLRTYASYWIRAEIRDYVVRAYRIVRLGTTRTERRAMRTYRSTAVASPEELAEQSGMPASRARLLWPLLAEGDRSLDFARNGAAPLRDSLQSSVPDPECALLEREQREAACTQVSGALEGLSEREARIVRARMMVDEPVTLERLGRRLGVSRERVRQLESRARTKIRESLVA